MSKFKVLTFLYLSRDQSQVVSLGIFFRGSSRRNHVPWGRFSLWKWVPGISPGVKTAGAYGWRPTTLVVPIVTKLRGLNLPGPPWATSACCGMTFTITFLYLTPFSLIDRCQCIGWTCWLPSTLKMEQAGLFRTLVPLWHMSPTTAIDTATTGINSKITINK